MDNMLQDILVNTYNPDPVARKQAEAALEQYLHNSGAFFSLLDFTKTQEKGRDLRLAASIVAKNKARSYWRTDEDVLPISPEEKETCKTLLLEILLVEEDTAIRGMLAETVRTIAEFDFPNRFESHVHFFHISGPHIFFVFGSWPELLPTFLTNIGSSDILRMYNALYALRKVVKRYEYKHK